MGKTKYSNHRYRGYLSRPILYPLVAVFFIFGGAFVALFSWHLSNSIDAEIASQIKELETVLLSDIESDARHMRVETNYIKEIPGLKQALINGDREQLLELSAPLFKQLHHHFHITHLYFTGPDRINIARAHEPSRFGDRIERYTTLKAQESGEISSGLELGILGTFTLRVVMPWYEADQLIGFIEIGEEIDHITEKIRMLLQIDALVFIDKSVLTKELWLQGIQMLGRDSDWDRFPNHIYLGHAHDGQSLFPSEIIELLSSSTNLINDKVLDVTIPQRHIKAAFMPLYDVENRRVGELLLSIDVTRWINSVYFSILLSIAIGFLANIFLISLLMRLARRTEDELNDNHEQLIRESSEKGQLHAKHIEELEAKNRALELSQSRLSESESQLSRAQQLAHLGSWEWDFEKDVVTCSDEMRAILGHSCEFNSCQMEMFNQHIHQDDRAQVRQGLAEAINGIRPFDQEYRIVRDDGSIRLIHGQAELIAHHKESSAHLIGTMQDCTTQRHTEEINRHLGNILDNASNEIILFSAESMIILQANHTAQQHLNYSEKELYSMALFEILKSVDEEQFNLSVAPLDGHISHEIQMEAELQPKDGPAYPVELRIQKSHYHSEPVYIALALDASEKRAQQQALVHQGLHDPLTNLPNRLQLTKQTLGSIKSAQITAGSVVLVLININRFQEINDTLGHNNGDRILLQYAKRIQTIMPDYCTLFHIGGDNFAILLTNFDSANINTFIHRIEATLQRPFSTERYNLSVDSSFGVAAFPEHAHNEVQLMQFAEIALKRSKEFMSGVEVYNPNLDPFSVKRLMITSHMRHAIKNGEFSLYYQPKVQGPGAIPHSAEALIRWSHKEHGFITPSEFIPLAEKTGYIREITHWVINDVLQQMAQWQERGIKIPIAINISAHNLLDPKFVQLICDLTQQWQVPHHRLTLEVTETAVMMDPEFTIAALNRLNDQGFNIAIDDYGTGYSSLSYLKQLPADELKIDCSFILHMLEDDDSYTIVYSTIELAHNLGMSVTAEGVESRAISDHLLDLGCELQQGFFFSKPLPVAEFEAWLKRDR
jgi:diguanylate cyclase (GGDEF)-like protein/PAS domain S-box-containing protein